jgi:hypothetical protein
MYAMLCDNNLLTTEEHPMKIEIYYYDLIEAIQDHVNKRFKSELNFEDFEGDRLSEVTIVTHNYDKPGVRTTVNSYAFGEGDSFSFYFD